MKLHPLTPIVAMICITFYGSVLAIVGINSTITILVVASISGLGGFGIEELYRWQKKKNSASNNE